MTTTIKATPVIRAINALVLASVSYADALDVVKKAADAGQISKADAVIALALAYEHHAPGRYAGQRDAETGKPIRNSALEAKVRYDLRGIFYAEQAKGKGSIKDAVEVPTEIARAAALLAKLCNEYEGARKLASQAIAEAFAA